MRREQHSDEDGLDWEKELESEDEFDQLSVDPGADPQVAAAVRRRVLGITERITMTKRTTCLLWRIAAGNRFAGPVVRLDSLAPLQRVPMVTETQRHSHCTLRGFRDPRDFLQAAATRLRILLTLASPGSRMNPAWI